MATKRIVLVSGVGAEIAPLKTTHIGRIFKFDNFEPVKAFKEALLDGLLISLGEKKKITEADLDQLTDADLKFMMFHIRLLTYPPNYAFEIVQTWADKGGEEFTHRHSIEVNEGLLQATFAKGASKDKPIYANYSEINQYNDFVLPESGLTVRLHLLTTKESEVSSDTSLIGMIKQRNPILVREDGEVESLVYDFDDKITSVIDTSFLFDKIIEREGLVKSTVVLRNPVNNKQAQSVELIYLPNFFFPSLSKLL